MEEARSYLIKEIEWIYKKWAQKHFYDYKLYWRLYYIVSTVTGCAIISNFAPLLDFPIGITSAATGLEMCPITAEIKKYKLSIQEKKKKHKKIAKQNLNFLI